MKTKRQKRVTLALLSLTCVFAVAASLFATGLTGVVKADDNMLYSQDFESLSADFNGDEIYQNSGWAGGTRSIVQSTGTYLKAPYQFWDNGCQQSAVYTNTSRIIPTTTEGKDYTLTMRVKPYGDFKDLTLGVMGPDTAKNNSVIILNSGANGTFINYVENSNFISGTAVLGADGWYDINATVKGTGGYVHFVFYMNVEKTRYEEINAANATGICLDTLKFADSDTVVYELELAPGLFGESELFNAYGLAGFASAAGTYKDGINGKTLRSVYSFFPAGTDGTAFQTEPLYVNENWISKTLEKDKTYYVEFTIRPFGHVKQTFCMFNQVVNQASSVDSQIIIKSDNSHSTAEYGTDKVFGNVTVTQKDGCYKVSAEIKGTGGLFKLFFNIQSSDPAAANANNDTGIYLDDVSIKTEKEPEVDPTEGEYKVVLSRNFNNDPLDVSGSDAMFHTNGFAGVAGGQLTIKDDGFNGDRCLSAMFDFFVDNDGGGWQKANLYLDSGKLGNTSDGKIYRWDMQIKPTGSVDMVYIGFESQKPSIIKDYVRLQNGEAYVEAAASGSKLIKAVLNGYADGVYNVSIYVYGNGGYTFNFINAHCTDSATANANFDSGVLLDNYSISVKREAEAEGFNVTKRFYNTHNAKDLTMVTTFADVETVTVDGTAINAQNYAFANGILTIKADYLKDLSDGVHEIVAENAAGTQSTLMLNAAYVPTGEIYNNDFTAMPELNGDQDANDNFFRNSWFDPADYKIYTEGTENKVIKFVPKTVDESNVGLFQTNPNDGRMHYLTKDKRHVLSLDLKPMDNSVIAARGLTHDASADIEFFFMEIDLKTGKLISGTQNADICYDVTAKMDGWYRLTISFSYEYAGESYAYVQFKAAAPTLESVWYMDNFVAESEVFAELVSSSSNYDLGADAKPYAIIALNGFEIVSVKEGETALVKDADYTLEVTPTGSYRMNLTEAFCEKYNLGDQKTITITTSKNVITFEFAVINSTPEMQDTASCDIAEGIDIIIAADLKGYTVALITVDGSDLSGSEYMYNANNQLVLKYNYLKGLTAGEHVFIIKTASGAQKTLTVTINDSTPVFGTAADYDKKTAGDYVIDLNLSGKEITEVKFDKAALTAEQYSYANDKLTVKASVFANKNAGTYLLEVTTVASASVTVKVLDVAPEFEGEYEVSKGSALVITVNLNGRDIVSLTAGELVLTTDDYSYANGKLTINPEVLSELAAGKQTVILTTTGGSAQITFTLKDAGSAVSSSGCSSFVGGSLALTLVGAVAIVWLCRKRRKQN